ncbi:hypothetical protein [Nonomuraea sp. NPDC050643]|uniref:hypothetical protein n=1 Tax=Nonomuraea sp. NPDC050643 TaxID=3155660 RepID=UPI0033C834DA
MLLVVARAGRVSCSGALVPLSVGSGVPVVGAGALGEDAVGGAEPGGAEPGGAASGTSPQAETAIRVIRGTAIRAFIREMMPHSSPIA